MPLSNQRRPKVNVEREELLQQLLQTSKPNVQRINTLIDSLISGSNGTAFQEKKLGGGPWQVGRMKKFVFLLF